MPKTRTRSKRRSTKELLLDELAAAYTSNNADAVRAVVQGVFGDEIFCDFVVDLPVADLRAIVAELPSSSYPEAFTKYPRKTL